MHRLIAFALALTLAGCGAAQTGDTGDFTGDEGQVAGLVGELSSAATAGEESVVCSDLLSDRLVDEIIGSETDDVSCTSEVEKAFRDADAFIVDVEDVTIGEGATEATAVVSSAQVGEDITRTFSFVKEDDEWRIDSFG